MSVNGITNQVASDVYQGYTSKTKKAAAEAQSTTAAENEGAIYEASQTEASSAKKTYKQDPNLIAQLKADAEARTSQLRTLVEQMMTKQGTAYNQANGIWAFLAQGNYTVDPQTQAQAQADIAEDGYWGVTQTSNRILDFATALTGGDPDKIEAMREAFQKGYAQAEKTWGGKLPEISQKTYDAVMEKFDQLAAQAKTEE